MGVRWAWIKGIQYSLVCMTHMPFTLYAYAHTHTYVENFPSLLYKDGSFTHVPSPHAAALMGGGYYLLGN